MTNEGKSHYTIHFTSKALSLIGHNCNMQDPEQVKAFIAKRNVSSGYKRNLCIAYNRYCKHYKIDWNMPKYTQEAKNVALPTREKLLMLISNAEKLLLMKLQLSMETGLRPVELSRLKVKDIDLDHKTVNPTTAKKGNPRTLPMTANLTTKIQEHIIRKNLSPNDQLFRGLDPDHYGKPYRMMRNKLAQKLKDSTIHTIRLYDFRHYFCTKKLYDINNPIHRNGTHGT